MTEYRAPLTDMRFTLTDIVGIEETGRLPGLGSMGTDVIDAVLEQAGRLASEVIGPLNEVGDRERSRLENGAVRTPTGYREAYQEFIAGGWNAAPFDTAIGGQGLPWSLTMALFEMWEGASLAFSLCPTLTQAAIECLNQHGSEELKALYLDKLVSGVWPGTMNLTEPQAGSDLGTIGTRAERFGDHYRLRGTKIFITYGDHDLAENIVHIVLARSPDGPPGVRGLSCFLVPKFIVEPDGSLGARNDVKPISLEHKLGIHGSPTLTMAYGEDGGAVGYLLGAENAGIEVMFTMMNNARLLVGLEGVGLAERAYQQALAHARERQQGRPRGTDAAVSTAIIGHPDVRRMLMLMKAKTEAARAVAYLAASCLDHARRNPDAEARPANQRRLDLLTPVVKAWCSEVGVEVTSLGLQVHGGMGYIEETGAARLYRDSRIVPIYEGTNGIQALDLVGRKVLPDDGAAMAAFLGDVDALIDELGTVADAPARDGAADLSVIRRELAATSGALEAATSWLTGGADGVSSAVAGATPFLHLFGAVAGGHGLARGAIAAMQHLADGSNDAFYRAKITTARFYAEQILPPASALLGPITRGTDTLFAIAPEHMG